MDETMDTKDKKQEDCEETVNSLSYEKVDIPEEDFGSFSDSDSDDEEGKHKSIHFHLFKGYHVPGKYKNNKDTIQGSQNEKMIEEVMDEKIESASSRDEVDSSVGVSDNSNVKGLDFNSLTRDAQADDYKDKEKSDDCSKHVCDTTPFKDNPVNPQDEVLIDDAAENKSENWDNEKQFEGATIIVDRTIEEFSILNIDAEKPSRDEAVNNEQETATLMDSVQTAESLQHSKLSPVVHENKHVSGNESACLPKTDDYDSEQTFDKESVDVVKHTTKECQKADEDFDSSIEIIGTGTHASIFKSMNSNVNSNEFDWSIIAKPNVNFSVKDISEAYDESEGGVSKTDVCHASQPLKKPFENIEFQASFELSYPSTASSVNRKNEIDVSSMKDANGTQPGKTLDSHLENLRTQSVAESYKVSDDSTDVNGNDTMDIRSVENDRSIDTSEDKHFNNADKTRETVASLSINTEPLKENVNDSLVHEQPVSEACKATDMASNSEETGRKTLATEETDRHAANDSLVNLKNTSKDDSLESLDRPVQLESLLPEDEAIEKTRQAEAAVQLIETSRSFKQETQHTEEAGETSFKERPPTPGLKSTKVKEELEALKNNGEKLTNESIPLDNSSLDFTGTAGSKQGKTNTPELPYGHISIVQPGSVQKLPFTLNTLGQTVPANPAQPTSILHYPTSNPVNTTQASTAQPIRSPPVVDSLKPNADVRGAEVQFPGVPETSKRQPNYRSMTPTKNTGRDRFVDETSLTAENGIYVQLKKEDIGKQQVDVVVVAVPHDLDLKNAPASRSVLEAGGPGLQNELKKKRPKKIKAGDIVNVSGNAARWKEAYLIALPTWKGDGDNAKKAVDEAVNKCLISVANSAMTKVAFGALGCGLLMYPPDIIAETMFDAVINFDTNRHGGSDLHVSFVVYTDDESVVKAFEEEAKIRSASFRHQ